MNKGCTAPDTGTLLHAFELGLLSEEEDSRFEQHLLSCQFCFEQVREFEKNSEILRSDSDLLTATQLNKTDRKKGWLSELWPEKPFLLRPAISYAAAAILLVILIGSLLKSGTPIRPVQSLVLVPTRSLVSAVVDGASNKDLMITFLYRGAKLDREYRVRLLNKSGETIYRDEHFTSFDDHETGRLLVPHEYLKPGAYRLIIDNPDDDTGGTEQEYQFTVR